MQEEVDFAATRQTFELRNGISKTVDNRPASEILHDKKPDLTHRRPSSLSNIQLSNPLMSLPGPESPTKHVEFAKENMLLRRVQQQQYKRTVSNYAGGSEFKDSTMTHRRTQSSIPFGNLGKDVFIIIYIKRRH